MSHQNRAIELILWDATSEPQVQRLRQQRLICGWGADRVETWRCQQISREKALYWIVINPNHKFYIQYMEAHMQHFPLENDVLYDGARAFIPIGHVSMDLAPNKIIGTTERRYYASNLYLSPALRGRAFARSSIEAVMSIAANAPFFATTAVAEVPTGQIAGESGAKFSLTAWYEMLGWKRVKEVTRSVVEIDTRQREVGVELALYECDVRGFRRVMEKAVL